MPSGRPRAVSPAGAPAATSPAKRPGSVSASGDSGSAAPKGATAASRATEREAEAMIVDHAKAEIAFYSDAGGLCDDLKRDTISFEGLRTDASFWNKRGLKVNPGKLGAGERMSRIDRLKTKAARVFMLHAARIAEVRVNRPRRQSLFGNENQERAAKIAV